MNSKEVMSISPIVPVIAIEDDIIVGKGFLHYINWGLETYADSPKVVGVSAYLPEFLEDETIMAKIEYNRTRKHRHGGKKF